MKKPSYLLFSLFIASCVAPKQYHQRINYIPTQGPNFGVEVLREDELPSRPYFEVIDFDLSEKGKLNSLEAKKILEMEAIKEGVDAVVMLDTWNEYREEQNFLTFIVDVLDEDGENTVMNVPYTYVRGIGLKYLDNINDLDQHPEFEYVYLINPETDLPEPFFKIEYNPIGQEHRIYPESDDAERVYSQYLQYFSDFHLIHQRERWYYKKKHGQLKKRVLINERGFVVKTCMFYYDEFERLSRIEVSNKGRGFATVNYHYNSKGEKQAKSVVTDRGVRIYEQFHYVDGKLDGRKIRIIRPGTSNYLLNTSILYYDPDFLREYYRQEHADEQGTTSSK